MPLVHVKLDILSHATITGLNLLMIIVSLKEQNITSPVKQDRKSAKVWDLTEVTQTLAAEMNGKLTFALEMQAFTNVKSIPINIVRTMVTQKTHAPIMNKSVTTNVLMMLLSKNVSKLAKAVFTLTTQTTNLTEKEAQTGALWFTPKTLLTIISAAPATLLISRHFRSAHIRNALTQPSRQ